MEREGRAGGLTHFPPPATLLGSQAGAARPARKSPKQLPHTGNSIAPSITPEFFRALLETVAAQGEVIYQDDTPVRILSLIEETRQPAAQAKDSSPTPARTGMYTTVVYSFS